MEWSKLQLALSYAYRILKKRPYKRYILCYQVQRGYWSILDCDSARAIVQHYQDRNHYLLARLTEKELSSIVKLPTIQQIAIHLKAYAHTKADQSGLPLLNDLINLTGGK